MLDLPTTLHSTEQSRQAGIDHDNLESEDYSNLSSPISITWEAFKLLAPMGFTIGIVDGIFSEASAENNAADRGVQILDESQNKPSSTSLRNFALSAAGIIALAAAILIFKRPITRWLTRKSKLQSLRGDLDGYAKETSEEIELIYSYKKKFQMSVSNDEFSNSTLAHQFIKYGTNGTRVDSLKKLNVKLGELYRTDKNLVGKLIEQLTKEVASNKSKQQDIHSIILEYAQRQLSIIKKGDLKTYNRETNQNIEDTIKALGELHPST